MKSVRDKVTLVLIGSWVVSVLLFFSTCFMNLEEGSRLFHYAFLAFFISSFAGVTFIYIKDHPGPVLSWIVIGIAVIAIISVFVFAYEAGHGSSEDEYGVVEYKKYVAPTFESRSVAATTMFGRCFIGLCVAIGARLIILKDEIKRKKLVDARESVTRW